MIPVAVACANVMPMWMAPMELDVTVSSVAAAVVAGPPVVDVLEPGAVAVVLVELEVVASVEVVVLALDDELPPQPVTAAASSAPPTRNAVPCHRRAPMSADRSRVGSSVTSSPRWCSSSRHSTWSSSPRWGPPRRTAR